MKNMILTGWTFSRVLWVLFGIVIITEAILRKELVPGIAGLLYTAMGVFNRTICGLGLCSFSPKVVEKADGNDDVKQTRKIA